MHGSPCWEGGDNSSKCASQDIDGQPRILYTTIDIGADEYLDPAGIDEAAMAVSGPQIRLVEANPVGVGMTFAIDLPKDGFARLAVFDIQGRLVKALIDDHRLAGVHEVVWDLRSRHGTRVPTGVYYARLETGADKVTQKIVSVR